MRPGVLCPQGKEPSVRQLALLHFRNTITLSVKLEDALARAHARVPPAIVQMLLVLQVGGPEEAAAKPCRACLEKAGLSRVPWEPRSVNGTRVVPHGQGLGLPPSPHSPSGCGPPPPTRTYTVVPDISGADDIHP